LNLNISLFLTQDYHLTRLSEHIEVVFWLFLFSVLDLDIPSSQNCKLYTMDF